MSDKTEWFKMGQLQSPAERLGLDKYLYKEAKKKELFTNTKDYLTKRNEFLQKSSSQVNNKWKEFMERDDLKEIPIAERTQLADRLAKSTLDEYQRIAEELYPNADLGYKQASNLNVAQNVVEGNIVTKAPAKKRGRKPKTEKKTKATAKKRGRPPKKSAK